MRTSRAVLVACLSLSVVLGAAPLAWAQADCETCANQEEGDNEGSVDSAGGSASGDAIGGQVVGNVSAGDTSIDAKNRSEDIEAETGDAVAGNHSSSFTGLNGSTTGPITVADATAGIVLNQQEGDNDLDVVQSVDATSGDAVGGQVIGAVTSAGGSADIVADNASREVDLESGAAFAENENFAFVGLNVALNTDIGEFAITDVSADEARNQQHGDNDASFDQTASAGSGDAVGGQVIGAVSAGVTSIDAKNRTEDAAVETGTVGATNDGDSLTGLDATNILNVGGSTTLDASAGEVVNQQDGDNETVLTQSASATSGDGVGGQVIGAVTSAGGSADIVADNASKEVDVTTGSAESANAAESLVGQNTAIIGNVGGLLALDAEAVGVINQQHGDNAATHDQTAQASSGDGVAGQVIGSVSAGDTSIDARNRSDEVDVHTGDAFAQNHKASAVGLTLENVALVGGIFVAVDAVTVFGVNQQDGDNEMVAAQSADAASGDGVGGQVIGAVTSSGGSADIVADNASKEVDVSTGSVSADNDGPDGQVGLDFSIFSAFGGLIVSLDAEAGQLANQQDGDNSFTLDQSAEATSGDGVGGQVIGAVSAGATSIDARNRSEEVDVTTGDVDVDNDGAYFVGHESSFFSIIGGTLTVDVEADSAFNQQDGDNNYDLTQSVTGSSGDGVGGQVIGAVTSSGGSADIVADNASKDVDIATGEVVAGNNADAFVGLADTFVTNVGGDVVSILDAAAGQVDNQQDGDNEASAEQLADASSGDGVGGQVLGFVSAGDASIDARNRTEDVSLETGSAFVDNDAAFLVGLNLALDVNVGNDVIISDVEADIAANQQDGNNELVFSQTAEASSGDAVAGQVAGVVTSAGGSADLVLDNASKDIEAETGPTSFENIDSLFVGLSFVAGTL